MDIEARKKKGVWASVFRSLPNYNENETSASYRLRKSYEKYLLEFELSEQGVPLPRHTGETGYGRKKRKRDPSQKGAAGEKGSSKGVGKKKTSSNSVVMDKGKGKPTGSSNGDESGSQKEEAKSDQKDSNTNSATSSGDKAKKAKTD